MQKYLRFPPKWKRLHYSQYRKRLDLFGGPFLLSSYYQAAVWFLLPSSSPPLPSACIPSSASTSFSLPPAPLLCPCPYSVRRSRSRFTPHCSLLLCRCLHSVRSSLCIPHFTASLLCHCLYSVRSSFVSSLTAPFN